MSNPNDCPVVIWHAMFGMSGDDIGFLAKNRSLNSPDPQRVCQKEEFYW